jgi:hypothetical protein
MYKNFSLTDKEKKEILEQHGRHGYKQPKEQISRKKKPLNEQPFGDDGKFIISHVGIPVKEIQVNVELSEDHENDSVRFTLEIDENGNLTIVDFENESRGEIDDREVKSFMESIIANNELNVPDYIDFDPETGKLHNY